VRSEGDFWTPAERQTYETAKAIQAAETAAKKAERGATISNKNRK
jgi:hypothetical protein